ncbi:MAG: hypothetical protein FWC67_01930 [Defluviitaleaceae bacterium]|nr:hypothetical protein [Defluviitaleaceae bacterium]
MKNINELANCRCCKKAFTMTEGPFCPDCASAEEEIFGQVKDFLYTNTNCNLNEVSECTGVSTKRILSYIRDGRVGQ